MLLNTLVTINLVLTCYNCYLAYKSTQNSKIIIKQDDIITSYKRVDRRA